MSDEAWAQLTNHLSSRKFLPWAKVREFATASRIKTIIHPWYHNTTLERQISSDEDAASSADAAQLRRISGHDPNGDNLTNLAETISEKSPRLLTLLLLHVNFPENGSKQSKIAEIVNWTKAGIDDSILNCRKTEAFRTLRAEYQQRLSSRPSSFALLEEILDQRWTIPPVFIQGSHYEDPLSQYPGAPFLSEEDCKVSGSYGKMRTVELEPSHFEFQRVDEPHSIFSKTRCMCKTVRLTLENREESLREVLVLNAITKSRSPYIVELLASFEMVTLRARGPLRELCMIFPHALQDLSHWLETPHQVFGLGDDKNPALRQQYSYNAIWSITSGVAFLHGQSHGMAGLVFHHDLKPRNVLVFDHDSRPVWKLCDFGNSSLRESHRKYMPTYVIGTYSYRAPEYDSHSEFSRNMHGTAFDDFALGCILLEICIVLIHGWGENLTEKFRFQRLQNKLDCYHAVLGHEKITEDDSYHNNMPIVEQWLSGLVEKNMSDIKSEKLAGVLEVVEGLLNRHAADRLLSWEALLDLFETNNPLASIEKIRNHCMEHVQPAPVNLGWGNSNPLHRALSSQNQERVKVLEQKGWQAIQDQGFQPTTHGATVSKSLGGPYLSILPRGLDNIEMVGRKTIFDEINDSCLGGVSRIALYGRGGIGKSRIAFHYLQELGEFMQGGRCIMPRIKHRFWVSATSETKLLEDYGKIASEASLTIKLRTLAYRGSIVDHPLLKDVNSWLEDHRNQPWMMVLDDLVGDQFGATPSTGRTPAVVKSINQLIPRCTTGKTYILVTARDLADVTNWTDKQIHVDNMKGNDAMEIFRKAHAPKDFLDTEHARLRELVDYLGTPQLIQMAAIYIKRHRDTGMSVPELCNILQSPRPRREWLSRQFEQFGIHPSGAIRSRMEGEDTTMYCMSTLIGPLLKKLNQNAEDDEGKAAGLLETIATLSRSNIDEHILRHKYVAKDQHLLGEWVSILFENSLLERKFETTLSIHELLQDTVLIWHLSNPEGVKRLLLNLDETLSMLYLRYRELKEAPQSLESWKLKLGLFPHLDRLLFCFRWMGYGDQETLENIKAQKVGFSLCAVNSVLVFARELRIQARYDDAKLLLRIFTSSRLANTIPLDTVRSTRSALFRSLGLTLEATAVGRDAKSNLEEARARYRRAKELKPEDWRLMIDEIIVTRHLKDTRRSIELLDQLKHFLNKQRQKLGQNDDLIKAELRLFRQRIRTESGTVLQHNKTRNDDLVQDLRDNLFLHDIESSGAGFQAEILVAKTDLAIELSKDERSRPEAVALAEECSQMLEEQEQADVEGGPAREDAADPASADADMRIWDAKCQIALVYRYLREHVKERNLLWQTHQHHVRKLGIEHRETRLVAYALRLALLKCNDIREVLILQDQFEARGVALKLIPKEHLQEENISLTAEQLTKIGVQ